MGIKSQTGTLRRDEESWLFLVVLLQKLKEFSVLSLYRNLMALNRRALITVTGWAEGPTALANSWTAAGLQSWARVCLVFESGILGRELLAAGAQESSATFTNQSVTIAEKNSSGGMCVSNLKPQRLPGAVSALCWGLEQMDLAELLTWLTRTGSIYSNRSSSGLERPLSRAGCGATGSLLAMLPDSLFLSITLGFVSRGDFCYL